jgi:hypothetical protein
MSVISSPPDSLSSRLDERQEALASCQDPGRLLARLRNHAPHHPVLGVRLISLWVALFALVLACLVGATPALLAELDAMGVGAAGILESKINRLNRMVALPLNMPALPSILVLTGLCGLVIRSSMHALALHLGQSFPLLAWESTTSQTIQQAQATLSDPEFSASSSGTPRPTLDLEALDWAGSGEPFGSTPIEPERLGALRRSQQSPSES